VKQISYLSVAEAELVEAAEYYDKQQPGLGRIFLDAVTRSEAAIRQNPERLAFYERPIRGCRVLPFPYRLLFRELSDRIQIICVMHLSRRPSYWKDRIS
jgi:hypothetical protein